MGEIDQHGKYQRERGKCGRCSRPLPLNAEQACLEGFCHCASRLPVNSRVFQAVVLPPCVWEDRRPLYERALEYRKRRQWTEKKAYKCAVCGKTGHNARTCQEKNSRVD